MLWFLVKQCRTTYMYIYMKVFISTYIHISSPFYLLKELTFYFTICEEKQHFLSKRFLYERINKMITSSSLYMFHLSIYLYNEGYFIIRIMGFIILIQIAWIHFLCAGNRIVDIYAKNWVILWTYCKYCIIFINVLLNILYMNKIRNNPISLVDEFWVFF